VSPIQTADDPGWVDEYQAMLDAYREAGGNPTMLSAPNVAALVVSSNRVLARSEVPGVRLQVQERPTGIVAEIRVDPGARRDEPVHLCFGMLQAEGIQEIESSFEIGAGADVRFITHCTFPRATRLRHAMDADIHIASDASMEYTEGHYHGQQGGIEVVPRARIVVDDGARFLSTFSLARGRVGRLEIDYDIVVGRSGLAELTTKAFGRADDRVQVHEVLHLDGEGARGIMKTRIAVRDDASSEVSTTAEGTPPSLEGTWTARRSCAAEPPPRTRRTSSSATTKPTSRTRQPSEPWIARSSRRSWPAASARTRPST
jgi:hypothetical protein